MNPKLIAVYIGLFVTIWIIILFAEPLVQSSKRLPGFRNQFSWDLTYYKRAASQNAHIILLTSNEECFVVDSKGRLVRSEDRNFCLGSSRGKALDIADDGLTVSEYDEKRNLIWRWISNPSSLARGQQLKILNAWRIPAENKPQDL